MLVGLSLQASHADSSDVVSNPVSAGLGLYGGFIVIAGGASTLRVPYFGLKGSYQTLNPVQYVSFGYDSMGTSVPHATVVSIQLAGREICPLMTILDNISACILGRCLEMHRFFDVRRLCNCCCACRNHGS